MIFYQTFFAFYFFIWLDCRIFVVGKSVYTFLIGIYSNVDKVYLE